jgi:hypothetical protein
MIAVVINWKRVLEMGTIWGGQAASMEKLQYELDLEKFQ